MDSFFGFSANEIEENVIKPSGGLERFMLVICPGHKIPRYTTDDGTIMDLIIEDDRLNNATIAYLEYCKVKEIDWRED